MMDNEENIHHKEVIKTIDDLIRYHELEVERLQLGRREYINRHNLNKNDFEKAYLV